MNCYITGAFIKKLRENKRMTQAELAEIIGVSDKAVSKWETGKSYPDITLLDALGTALGVSVGELLTGQPVLNRNISANMKRSSFYVCPVCGNIIVAAGNAVISCHGITLPPLSAEPTDAPHTLSVQSVENEYYVSADHPMEKTHFLSFFAVLRDNGIEIVKLYPEGAAEARFQQNRVEKLYAFCNRHGLFEIKI